MKNPIMICCINIRIKPKWTGGKIKDTNIWPLNSDGIGVMSETDTTHLFFKRRVENAKTNARNPKTNPRLVVIYNPAIGMGGSSGVHE